MICCRILFYLLLILLWCRPRSESGMTGSVLPGVCPPCLPFGAIGRSPRHFRFLKRAGGSQSNRRPKIHGNLFLVFFLGSSEKNGPGQKRKQQSRGNVPVLRPHTTSPITFFADVHYGRYVSMSSCFFFVNFTLRYGIIMAVCEQ